MRLIHSVFMGLMLFFSLFNLLAAQSAYRYSYMPKSVYENQVFSVTLVGPNTHSSLTFDLSSSTQPLFKKPLLVKNGTDTFYTFYFKAGRIPIEFPILFINSSEGYTTLPSKIITVEKLNSNKPFSFVLATDMKIKSQQVSNYDAKSHIVTLTLEAYEANLEDMKLQNVEEFGIDSIKRKNAKVVAEFYAVLPRKQKELVFSYYNTVKRAFVNFHVPVEVVNASVTTQSDLNPKIDAFERLKRYTLIVFCLFFLVMFIWKRDFFYLVLGVISLITLLTFYVPHKKICVNQGAPLYILPTETSTIGTYVSTKVESLLLAEHGQYKKIEYNKGMIGWIKNEDICKN